MKYQEKGLFFIIIISLLCISSVSRASTISAASEWSTNVSVLVNRNSPAPTTSVTDISGGVLLEYDAATGGINVGTSTRQYDFTQTALTSGTLLFDVSADVIVGTFSNTFTISTIKNDIVVDSLFSTAQNTASETFAGNSLSLDAGDIWGIRVVTGNFSLSTGTFGDIQVTSAVPIPAAAWLFLSGLGLLGSIRQYRNA